MTEQDKKLLLRDLCARLPYGVKILHNGWDFDKDCDYSTVETLIGIDDRFIYTLWRDKKDKHSIQEPLSILDYKPFLRSMSNMTENEKEEAYNRELAYIDSGIFETDDGTKILYGGKSFQLIPGTETDDWLNAHHFDFRGLISKGLALEAPINMYECL